jgi:hypothetical protein
MINLNDKLAIKTDESIIILYDSNVFSYINISDRDDYRWIGNLMDIDGKLLYIAYSRYILGDARYIYYDGKYLKNFSSPLTPTGIGGSLAYLNEKTIGYTHKSPNIEIIIVYNEEHIGKDYLLGKDYKITWVNEKLVYEAKLDGKRIIVMEK